MTQLVIGKRLELVGRTNFGFRKLTERETLAISRVVVANGRPFTESGGRVGARMLRRLVHRRLIWVVSLSPAVYRTTPMGFAAWQWHRMRMGR